jgi:uncharacterized membrane protein
MAERAKATRPPEHRWAAGVGVIAILVLYAFLPSSLLGNIRYIVIGVVVVLIVPVVILNPIWLVKETRWSRGATVAIAVIIVATNQVLLILLVKLLLDGSHDVEGILVTAVEVWGVNVIGFALLFWEIDRGGPVARHRRRRVDMIPADLRFPQDEDDDATAEVAVRSSVRSEWVPQFLDYLYVSLTNSMAFSPTDTMPLSHRMKLLMGLEGFAGFVTLALVIARAVNVIA